MNIKQTSYDEKNARRLSWIMGANIIGLFITNFNHVTLLNMEIIDVICKAAMLVAFLLNVDIFIRRFNTFIPIVLLAVISACGIQFVIFPQNVQFSSTLVTFVTTILPLMFVFSVMRYDDYGVLKTVLVKSSLTISIILAYFMIIGGFMYAYGYSMGFAGSLILPTNVLVLSLPECKAWRKAFRIVLIGFDIAAIFLYGSRGALVAVFVYIAYRVIVGFKENKSFIPFLIVFFGAFVLIFYRQIIEYISGAGFESRTLTMLIDGNISESNGRNKIYSAVISAIKNNPLAINGINGDYLITNGFYSHNIFLELIYTFGLFIGGALSLIIISLILMTLFKPGKKSSYNDIVLLLLFAFFPICLWSSCIWTNTYFWLWLVCITRSFSFKKKRQENTERFMISENVI